MILSVCAALPLSRVIALSVVALVGLTGCGEGEAGAPNDSGAALSDEEVAGQVVVDFMSAWVEGETGEPEACDRLSELSIRAEAEANREACLDEVGTFDHDVPPELTAREVELDHDQGTVTLRVVEQTEEGPSTRELPMEVRREDGGWKVVTGING